MVLVFAILFLLQGFINADAAPLSVLFSRQNIISPSLPQGRICPDTRSKWDIIWSCLVTIFACSWVSVHPNIPGPGEPWWKKALRRLELMFWSVISPELIIFWASKQWISARHLAKKYSDFKWTTTHGHFIQMGGFMLYDRETPIGVLSPEKLEDLLGEGKIEMPTITEEELKDRSKGDGLSKAVVIIQTTWFIAQYIARRVRGLIITELELVALAFAALNMMIMYAFWWNKPLDVMTTVPVILLQSTPPKSSMSAEPPQGETFDLEMETYSANDRDSPNVNKNEPSFLHGSEIEQEHLIAPSETQLHPAIANPDFSDFNFTRQAWRLISGILFRWPAAGALAVISRMGEIVDYGTKNTINEGQMHVNTFNTYDTTPARLTLEDDIVLYALPFISMLFGAIHCAGWNFFFPSPSEAIIWRVSSAVITGMPVIGLVSMLLNHLNDYYGGESFSVMLSARLANLLLILMSPLYILARLALLVEALISLRDLPLEALAAVEWTSFLPHV